MTTVYDPSHHLTSKKLCFKDLEIPPRKKQLHCCHKAAAMELPHHEARLHKYLPSNEDDDGTDDPYGTDHFRMYEFKVRRCTRSRSHDWTDCPFAHPGEKARRRDPIRYQYSSTICSDHRRGGGCPRGDDCEFAHGVFECWLHPTRYRTEACKDGKNCKRKVCFFAHSSRELRLLPESPPPLKYKNLDNNYNHCCLFCRSVTSSSSLSPTSTLLGLSHFSRSPSLSPPLSPLGHQQRTPRYGGDRLSKFGTEMTSSYDDVLLKEVMSCLGTMNLSEASSPMATTANTNIPWLDVSFKGAPSMESPSGSGEYFNGGGDDEKNNGNGFVLDHDLDLGWVNELLM
ncbi:hypothetical protein ES288_D01G024000v1 [Gossypium darwinii]|uniref:C3H1-type domain-containing protein n=1 Tax=Gossypium darwinii TaxID=34276 RepID=A0A5D2DJ44_GOSDA|nr:hypothetical protein ES288_D01G024000v1 [Gossypium darwinii]